MLFFLFYGTTKHSKTIFFTFNNKTLKDQLRFTKKRKIDWLNTEEAMNDMKALEKKMIETKQCLFTSEEFIQFLENEFEVSHLKNFNPKVTFLLPF